MKNNMISDKELSSIFSQDAANRFPDEAVRDRLEYAFMVKSRGYKTTQNSFLGLFAWLFSWSNLPLKAAMVSVVLLFSLVNIKNVETPILQQMQDTTLNTIPFHIDSSQTSPHFADTCSISKLIKSHSEKKTGQSEKEISILPNSGFVTTQLSSNADNNAPFVVPDRYVLSDRRILRKQQSVGSGNTIPAESPLLV